MIQEMVHMLKTEERFERYAVRVALVRESDVADRPLLNGPSAVYETFKNLTHLDRECVAVALLDARHRLNAVHAVHIGTAGESVIGFSDLFKAAILANARGIIMVHNHPSGNPEPSREDIELTRRIKAAADLLRIPLHDHVIVAADGYVSLKDRNVI